MVIWFVLKKECLGQQAESLVEGLLQHGRLTLEQMIQREAARVVKGYSLNKCDKSYHVDYCRVECFLLNMLVNCYSRNCVPHGSLKLLGPTEILRRNYSLASKR